MFDFLNCIFRQWYLSLISNFRRVLNIVCVLLCISAASDCGLPTFRNPLSVPYSKAPHPAFEDGTDRGFRNVGKPQSDAGEILKRTYTTFRTRRKLEIKNENYVLKITRVEGKILSSHIPVLDFSNPSLFRLLYVIINKTEQYSLLVR